MDFIETWHKYSAPEWALLKKLSRSKVKVINRTHILQQKQTLQCCGVEAVFFLLMILQYCFTVIIINDHSMEDKLGILCISDFFTSLL